MFAKPTATTGTVIAGTITLGILGIVWGYSAKFLEQGQGEGLLFAIGSHLAWNLHVLGVGIGAMIIS